MMAVYDGVRRLSPAEEAKAFADLKDWKMLNSPLGQPPRAPASAVEVMGIGTASEASRDDQARYFDAVKAMIEGGS